MDYDDFSGSDVSSNTSHTTDTGELDIVFFECDVESKGNIPVSRLLHYLREHAGFSEQGQNVELESLCSILDPDDTDMAIDIDTFRKGVLQWMSQVQEINENNMNINAELQDEKCDTSTLTLRSRLVSFGLTSLDTSKLSLLNASVNNYMGRDNMLNQSIETTGLASAEKHHLEQEIDVGELLSHVETLKFQNRKLMEDNSQLKEQMVTGEDTTTQLTQKLEALQKELKAYQGNQDRIQELCQENEDLKGNLSTLIEDKKELKQKIRQMERDNESLENSKLVLEGEIKTLATELDSIVKVKKDLQSSLCEEKKLRSEVERITEVQETELMEKGVKLQEMEKMMKHLNKVNETLRQEKNDAEMQLSHTQHELASMQVKSEHLDMDGSVELDVGTSITEDVMPVLELAPTAASTPFKVASLCTEIVVSMHDEPSLPSPLCDKEYEGVVEFNLSEELEDDMESMMKSASNIKKMPAKISQVASKLKQRNEIIIQQIDQLVTRPLLQFDSPVKQVGGAKPGVVRSILQKELSEYTDKIETLARAKTAAERRILRMTEMLKNIQEENRKAKEKQKVELEKLETESQEVSSRLEKQLENLNQRLEAENTEKENIAASKKDLEERVLLLEENIHGLEAFVSDLESTKEGLQKALQEQTHTNRELTKQYQRSKDALDELEDQYQSIASRKNEEEERVNLLEARIQTLQLKRQVDWRDLWRLVQTDSELSSDSTDQEGEDAANVSSVLRDQVTQEIEYLKGELVKSRATLKLLQTSPPQMGKHRKNIQNGAGQRVKDLSLVDALNLDSFVSEGSQGTRMKHIYRHHRSNNTLDLFSNHSNLVRKDSSSCPDLEKIEVEGKKCLQSQSRHDARRNAVKRRAPLVGLYGGEVDVSTSSGTSGIDISSCSNKSEKMKSGLYIEKLSGAEGTSGKEAYSHRNVLSPQNLTISSSKFSPRPSRDSFQLGTVSRSRTHSFRNAIERGPSGDSGISNPSHDRHENSSTSLDYLVPKQEDLLPQESDLIKIGLYTNKNRANLKQSTFRSGYYDRDYIHVPCSGSWNSHKELSYDQYYIPETSNNIDNKYSEQGEGSMAHQEFNHYLTDRRNIGPVNNNYNSFESAIDIRRLSILPEREEQEDSYSKPVPPPRRFRNGKGATKSTESEGGPNPPTSEHHSHLVAHHIPAKAPIKSPRLKKAGRKTTTVSPSADRTGDVKTEAVTKCSEPPSYEQAVETRLKEKICSGQDGSSDAVFAFQAVHGVPFNRPPPPYQKPFLQDFTTNQLQHQELADVTTESCDVDINGSGNSKTSPRQIQYGHLEKQDSEAKEFCSGIEEQEQMCDSKERSVEEISSEDNMLARRRMSLELLHNQPVLGSREDMTIDEVGNGYCAEEMVTTDTELTRTISFDEGGETVKVENTEKSKPSECDKSDAKLELLKEVDEGSFAEATKSDKINDVENAQKEVSSKTKTTEEEGLSLDMAGIQGAAIEPAPDKADKSLHNLPTPDSTRLKKGISHSSEQERPKTIQAKVFPSLSDKVLMKWGLGRKLGDPLECPELLSDQQVEEQYTNVVLCFKTDKQTLDQRVELHQRARDTTEHNIKEEMDDLQQAMAKLEPFCNDLKSREIYAKLQKHIDLLDISTDRLACRAETLGAAQQEFRVSRAVDVIVKHVENLKRMYETEHQELEETKRLIQENKGGQNSSDRNGRTVVGGGPKFGRRRASVAVLRGIQPLSHLNILSAHSNRNVQAKDDSTVQYANPSNLHDVHPILSGNTMACSDSSRSSHSSPLGGSVIRRRASVAVSSLSPERSSLLSHLHPSLLAYRTPRVNSLSSTSSEETVSSLGSFTIPGIIEQAAEEEEETSTAQHLAVKASDTTDTTEGKKEATAEVEGKTAEPCSESSCQKLAPDKEDSNNNNDTNTNKNNNNNLIEVPDKETEGVKEEAAIEGDMEVPCGLTDDSKLIMFQSAEQQYEDEIYDIQQTLAEMQRRGSLDRTAHTRIEHETLIARLWSQIPAKEELKLRLRYTLAGMIFFAAALCFIMTFVPTSDASDKPRYSRHVWTSLEEMLWPYITLKRNVPPPF